MQSPILTFKLYLEKNGYLDSWTSFHILAGAIMFDVSYIVLSFLVNHISIFENFAVLTIKLLSLLATLSGAILWEIIEYKIENWRPYGTKQRWKNNTISDIVVAVGMALLIFIVI